MPAHHCRVAQQSCGALLRRQMQVRVLPRQPFDALRLLMACGRLTSRSAQIFAVHRSFQSNGPELVEGPFSSARQPVTSPARHAGIARCDPEADDHVRRDQSLRPCVDGARSAEMAKPRVQRVGELSGCPTGGEANNSRPGDLKHRCASGRVGVQVAPAAPNFRRVVELVDTRVSETRGR